jgi:hypothetical protein
MCEAPRRVRAQWSRSCISGRISSVRRIVISDPQTPAPRDYAAELSKCKCRRPEGVLSLNFRPSGRPATTNLQRYALRQPRPSLASQQADDCGEGAARSIGMSPDLNPRDDKWLRDLRVCSIEMFPLLDAPAHCATASPVRLEAELPSRGAARDHSRAISGTRGLPSPRPSLRRLVLLRPAGWLPCCTPDCCLLLFRCTGEESAR